MKPFVYVTHSSKPSPVPYLGGEACVAGTRTVQTSSMPSGGDRCRHRHGVHGPEPQGPVCTDVPCGKGSALPPRDPRVMVVAAAVWQRPATHPTGTDTGDPSVDQVGERPSLCVMVSWGCWSKVLETRWLTATAGYRPSVLGPGACAEGGWVGAMLPLEHVGEGRPSLPLPASGRPRRSLACAVSL